MADNIPVARVSAVQGKAFVKQQDGVSHQVRVGDVVFEGEVVVAASGGRVDLVTPEGRSLVLRANETLTFDAEAVSAVKPDGSDAALVGGAGDLNRIIKAINEGGSLDALLEETAAGQSAGAADGGPTFVRLLRIVESVDPLAFQFATGGDTVVDNVVDGLAGAAAGGVGVIPQAAGPELQNVTASNAGGGTAGNAGSGNNDTVAIDTVLPVPTITLDANITADDLINAAEAAGPITITGTVGGDAKAGDTVTLTINGQSFSGAVVNNGGILTFAIPVSGADLAADPDRTIDASISTSDAAGNTGSASDSEGYRVDVSTPSVVVNIVDASLNGGDKVSTVTFTFSEAPVGFTLSDISAVGGTVSGLTPTADPKVLTATFTANDGFTGTGSVSVLAGSYSNAGGTPGTSGSDSVPIDTMSPSVVVNIVDASLNGGDKVSTVTFTFSEAPVGFTLSDISAVGGTVSGLTPTADPKVLTATFTANDGFSGTGSVSVLAGSYSNAGGTPGTSGSDSVPIDTMSPSVVVDIVDASLNGGDKVSTVTFTFSEAPVGFTLSDISAVGGTVSGLTPTADPKVLTATFTANDGFSGTGSVSVLAGSYSNAGGTPGTSGSDSVPIDTVLPVPTITLDANITADDLINAAEAAGPITITGTVGGDAKAGDTVTLTINGQSFSGAVVNNGGILTFAIPVSGADLAADPDRTIDASISTSDAAGNTGSASDSEGYRVDVSTPSVVVDIVDASLNGGDKVSTVTFTFSEAPFGFTLSDISAVGGTVSGLTPTADPKVLTATFTANDGFSGTGSVSVLAGSYSNAGGTPGTSGSDSVPIDTVLPVPTITLDANITADDLINAAEAAGPITITGTVGGDAKAGDTVTLTINGQSFSGAVVNNGGILTFAIPVSGADLAADPDRTIDASISTSDAAGNTGSASDSEGYRVDVSTPSVVVDIVDASLNGGDKVSTVTFTFSEAPFGFTLSDITVSGGTLTGLTPTADPKVFTATVTASDGFTGTGSVSVANASYNDAAGNVGSGGSDTVAIDTAAPGVVVNIIDAALNVADKVSTVTFTFSEAPLGFTLADIGTVGGTVSGLTPTADPKVFTATFTAADGFTGTGSVSVHNAGYTDAAGNLGSGNQDTVAIDTIPPLPTITLDANITADDLINAVEAGGPVTVTGSVSGDAKAGDTVALTINGQTFSGAVLDNGGVLGFAIAVPGADLAADPDRTIDASISTSDAAGNTGSASDSESYSVNAGILSVVVNIIDAALNVADKVSTVTFTFSEAPVGFTLADITVSGGTLIGLTPTADPKVFTATFTANDGFTGSGSVSVLAGSYSNAGGTPGTSGSDSVAIDTVSPSVVVDILDASLNVADKVSTVTFTFSEAPVGFTLADISASGGTVSGLAPTADPKVFTVTFTATDGFTGTGTVSVANASYTDAAGDLGSGNQDTVAIDTIPPLPTITLDANITADDLINAAEAAGPITVTGTVGGDAKAGDLVTLTINGQTFSGTVVDNGGILTFAIPVSGADLAADPDHTIDASISTSDAAGNTGSASDSEGYSVDAGIPSVVVNILDAALNVADKVSIVTFSFSEAPVGFTLADIGTVGGTVSGLTPTADPKAFTATFTAADGFSGPGSVSVLAGSYSNAAGSPGTSGSDSVAIDTVSPSVVVNILDASLNVADKVSQITFSFSEAPLGFTLADINASGGTVSDLTPTADPKVFTATFTASDGFSGTGSVSVANASYSNAAGTPGVSGSDTVAIDTVAPSVVVNILDTALNVADKVSTVTFSFSEAPVGFTLADISTSGGTVSGLTPTADPKVFTATFTANDGFTGSGSASVLAGSYSNAGGNAGIGNNDTVVIDTVSPSVVVDILDAALNVADKVSTVTFTFSEAPLGFTLADISTSGGTVSGLTPTADPKVFTATFTAADGFTDTGSVSVHNAGYTDATGNLGSGNQDTVAIDTVPPLPTITLDANITADDLVNAVEAAGPITVTGSVGGDAKAGDTVTLTINGQTFSGAVFDNGGVLGFAIAVPGADLAADPDRTIDASISASDAAGNTGSASDSEGYSVDISAFATITVDNITADNILTKAEAAGPVAVTGMVGGDAAPGDTVTVSINGTVYATTVRADNTFSISVAGAELVADTHVAASVTGRDEADNPFGATTIATHKLGPVAVNDVNSVSELAANTLYYNDSAGNIGILDPTTGARTLIGNAGVVFGDMAVGSTGTLYGIALSGSPNVLYSINPTTAAATRIGPLTGSSFVNALVASPDGRLFAAGSSGDLYQLSTATGAATRLGNFGQGSSGDLLFVDDALYLSTSAGTIRKFDLATGSVSTSVSGLPGNLYNLAQTDVGTFHAGTEDGRMYNVNLVAGTATLTGVVAAGQGMYGFAAAPVGSPLVTIHGDVTPGTAGQDYDPDGGTGLTVTGIAAGIAASPPATGVGSVVNGTYGTVTIAADGSYGYTLDNSRAAVQNLGAGQVADDVFTYTITDADGVVNKALLTIHVNGASEVAPAVRTVGSSGDDVLTGSIAADVMRGDAGNDTMSGGLGADTMIGGAGNDVMSGGPGADVFQWRFADRGAAGAPAVDTLTDFNNVSRASGGDVLDLRDLLQGENSSVSSLDNYLHFDVAGGSTTVQISSGGGFVSGYNAAAVDQQIVLSGVNLSVGGLTTDQLIIQDLLNKGKLITD